MSLERAKRVPKAALPSLDLGSSELPLHLSEFDKELVGKTSDQIDDSERSRFIHDEVRPSPLPLSPLAQGEGV